MRPRTIRYFAGIAIVPLAVEALPHAVESEDHCSGNRVINLCSASDDPWAIEPWNVHTPHQEFETRVGAAHQFLASGVSSITTSTGPASQWLAAGESAADRFIK
jgi:hypothetical protein